METWTILEKQVTGQTQYVTASWLQDDESDAFLNTTQSLPNTAVGPNSAVSPPFNIEGYGNGITMSYQVVSAPTIPPNTPNVQMALDTNNDMTGIIRNKNLIGSITTFTTPSNAITAVVGPTTTGTGTGATFLLTSTTTGGTTTFTSIEIITNSGSGYKPGDTFTWSPGALNPAFGVPNPGPSLVLTLQEDNLYIADNSWVETLTPGLTSTGTFFMTSKEAHGAARVRIKSANTGNLHVSYFRLICNS